MRTCVIVFIIIKVRKTVRASSTTDRLFRHETDCITDQFLSLRRTRGFPLFSFPSQSIPEDKLCRGSKLISLSLSLFHLCRSFISAFSIFSSSWVGTSLFFFSLSSCIFFSFCQYVRLPLSVLFYFHLSTYLPINHSNYLSVHKSIPLFLLLSFIPLFYFFIYFLSSLCIYRCPCTSRFFPVSLSLSASLFLFTLFFPSSKQENRNCNKPNDVKASGSLRKREI